MSTSNSPIEKLRAEAERISIRLKEMETGENLHGLSHLRLKDPMTMGIIQDDKVIKITIAWKTIKETTEEALTEYILGLMQGKKHDF